MLAGVRQRPNSGRPPPPVPPAARARGWLGWLEFDILLGDHALAEAQKRSVIRPIVAELQRRFSVSATETGSVDHHRRARIGQSRGGRTVPTWSECSTRPDSWSQRDRRSSCSRPARAAPATTTGEGPGFTRRDRCVGQPCRPSSPSTSRLYPMSFSTRSAGPQQPPIALHRGDDLQRSARRWAPTEAGRHGIPDRSIRVHPDHDPVLQGAQQQVHELPAAVDRRAQQPIRNIAATPEGGENWACSRGAGMLDSAIDGGLLVGPTARCAAPTPGVARSRNCNAASAA